MMRSPSSASATSSARSASGAITSASTSLFGVAVDQGGASGQRPDLGQELAGPLLDDRA